MGPKLNVKRGTYWIIRVNGEVTLHKEKPTLEILYKALGCDTLDCVGLGEDVVMSVDDEGMLKSLPVNPTATRVMWNAGRHVGHPVFGDAAICRDSDF